LFKIFAFSQTFNRFPSLSLIHGLLGVCDQMPDNQLSLLYRLHLENNLVRQFVEKDGQLVRFSVPISYIVTDTKPLEPLCNSAVTEDISLPDISPLNAFVGFEQSNVYNPQQNFPIKVCVISAPFDSFGTGQFLPIEESNLASFF